MTEPTANRSRSVRGRVAARITAARVAAGMTQTELARRLGVTQTALSYWEAAKREPTYDMLDAIARATGRPLASFVAEDAP